MHLTHTFASRETLSRAESWLTRHGFHPRHTSSGTPRIMIVDELNRLAAARMLINAVELADPNGLPGLWDQPTQAQFPPEAYQQDTFSEPGKPHSSVIGWHPLD
jgi:hypothetical protein